MQSETDLNVVLVVGGCGYLGSRIVKLLCSEITCTSVHVMSRNTTQNIHQNVNYHPGDITDSQQVTTLLNEIKPRVIIHTVSPRYTESDAVLRHTNLTGTRNLLQGAAATPAVRAFVYTSSDAILVPKLGVKLTEETAEIFTESSHTSPYPKTKAIADAEVRAANNPPTLHTATIRLPSIYGENDDISMRTLLTTAQKGNHKMQVGDNKRIFEFVYVDSAANAHILAAKALLATAADPQRTNNEDSPKGKVYGEAFFISDGVSLPYFDFARKIYALAGHPVAKEEIQVVPYKAVLAVARLTEWVYWIFTLGTKQPDLASRGVEYMDAGSEFSIDKAKNLLGYQPVADQDAVLKRVVEFEMKRLGM